jgi:hypothetical protein
MNPTEAKDFVAREAARLGIPEPTTGRNYAEQVEYEAHHLAVRLLAREAERTAREDLLSGWLARNDVLHAEAMKAAAEWAPPSTKLPPLTAENVSNAVVTQLAINRVHEVKDSNA